MALKDELRSGPPARKRGVGAVQRWLDSLSDEDQTEAYAAIADPEWSTSALHRLFVQHGLGVTRSTFGIFRDAF